MGKLRCKPGPVAAKSAANLPAPDIVLQIFLWHAPAMDKNYDRPVSRDYLLLHGRDCAAQGEPALAEEARAR